MIKMKKLLMEDTTSTDFSFQDIGQNKLALYESGVHIITFSRKSWLKLKELLDATL